MAGTHGGVLTMLRKSALTLPIEDKILDNIAPLGGELGRRFAATTTRLKACTVLLVTVYLVTGQPLDSPQNTAILGRLCLLLRLLALPAICMGDFQNTPVQMQESGWLARLRLSAAVPQGMPYTCKQGKKRMLDYFLVSPELEGQIRANEVVVDVPWAVHFGIQLELDMRVGEAVVRAPRVLRQLPPFLADFCQDAWNKAGKEATVRAAKLPKQFKQLLNSKGGLEGSLPPTVAPPELREEQLGLSVRLAHASLQMEIYALISADVPKGDGQVYCEMPARENIQETSVYQEVGFQICLLEVQPMVGLLAGLGKTCRPRRGKSGAQLQGRQRPRP